MTDQPGNQRARREQGQQLPERLSGPEMESLVHLVRAKYGAQAATLSFSGVSRVWAAADSWDSERSALVTRLGEAAERSGETVISTDLAPALGAGLYVGVPVNHEGRGAGALGILLRADHPVTGELVRDLTHFADLVSGALERLARSAAHDASELFNRAGDAIIVVDNDRVIRFMNESARALYRASRLSEGMHLSASGLWQWLRPEDETRYWDHIGRGHSWAGVGRQSLHAGRSVHMKVHATPTFDASGQAAGVIFLVREAGQLRDDQSLMHLLMRHADEILALHAPDGTLLYSSRTLAGGHADDLIGTDAYALVHPDDRERVRTESHLPALQGKRTCVEWRRPRPDGQDTWIESRISPVMDSQGQVEYLLVISRDTSDRRALDQQMRLMQSAVLAAGQAILITEATPIRLPGPRIVFVNDAFTAMTGYTQEEVLGRTPRLLQGPGTDQAALKRIREHLERWEPVEETLLNYTKGGRPFWVQMTITPIADSTGWYTHLISVQRDVTVERLERAYEGARRHVLEMVAAAEPLPSVLSAVVAMMEARWPHMTASLLFVQDGRLLEAVPSRLPLEYRDAINGVHIGPLVGSCGTAAFTRSTVITSDVRTDPHWSEELRELAARHALRSCWSAPILSGNQTVLGTFAVYSPEPADAEPRDRELLEDSARLTAVILERYRALDDSHRLALFDALTGLPNRALFTEQLSVALTQRAAATMCVVGLLNVNRFKNVNDSFGHIEADQLLVQLSRRLEGAVQRSGFLARMGGDEFAFLFEGLTAGAELDQLAQRLLGTFAAPFTVAGQQLHMSASLGFAQAVASQEPVDLLRQVDLAMAHAKARGLGWAMLDHADQLRSVRRLVDLESGLHQVAQRGELSLHYQPLVDRQENVVEVEALLRWTSPLLGAVSPAEFIPVAEKTGQILEIGAWVLRQACTDVAGLQQSSPGLRVAVNVSLMQFNHPNLVESVQQALSVSGLPAHLLTLEITESVLMDHEDAIRRILELRRLGVRLAIDDFGTGYSSMNYLRSLPIQSVKVDRTFVASIQSEGDADAHIVRAIAQLCAGLRLELTAEGVETPEQLRLLLTLGADLIQGWYYSRALDLAALRAWLPAPGARARSALARSQAAQ